MGRTLKEDLIMATVLQELRECTEYVDGQERHVAVTLDFLLEVIHKKHADRRWTDRDIKSAIRQLIYDGNCAKDRIEAQTEQERMRNERMHEEPEDGIERTIDCHIRAL